MIEHVHTFRLAHVELECHCGLRQVHEVVHGSELSHQQPSEYSTDRSVWERLERLEYERDEARNLVVMAMEWGTAHFEPERERYPWAYPHAVPSGDNGD